MNARRFGPGKLEKGWNYARTRKVWIASWTDARGKRHRQILSSDRRVAERAFAKIIRQRDLEALGLADEEGQGRTLVELRDRYLPELESWACPQHVRRIRGILERLLDHLVDITVRDLRKDMILTYRQGRLKQGRANRTVNLEVGALKAMLRWSLECGLIGRNPLANLKPLPAGKAHEKRPRRALTREEIDRLLEAAVRVDGRLRARHAAERSIADGTRGAAYRDRPRRPYVPQAPLWRALLYTGARWNELTSTRWGDVDLETGTLLLRAETTKSARERAIPLLEAVREDLGSLWEVQCELLGRDPRPDEAVFLGPRGKPVVRSYRRALYRFRELCDEAGIPETDALGRKIDIHSLRHTFCSELGRAGVGLTHAQALMGHSDPKLTAQLYTHLGTEDLRQAMGRIGSAASKEGEQRV